MADKIKVETPNVEKVVKADVKESADKNVSSLDSGAIGTSDVNPKVEVPKVQAKKKEDKVAVYSNGKLYWDSVGSLQKGYNLVTKEEAKQWLTLDSVREATPEEVAKEYAD